MCCQTSLHAVPACSICVSTQDMTSHLHTWNEALCFVFQVWSAICIVMYFRSVCCQPSRSRAASVQCSLKPDSLVGPNMMPSRCGTCMVESALEMSRRLLQYTAGSHTTDKKKVPANNHMLNSLEKYTRAQCGLVSLLLHHRRPG